MAGLKAVSKRGLRRGMTRTPLLDQIYAPLYDSATYTSGTTTTLSFFVTPKGQGTTTAPGATGSKSLADTNLQLAGQLATGNRFYCTGIEFQIFPGVNPGRGAVADSTAGFFVNDIYLLSKAAFVTLTIQNRNYIEDGPLLNFPSDTRLGGFTGSSTNLTTGAATYSEVSYAAVQGKPYSIVPLYIEATQAFSVTVTFPAAVTLASASNPRVFCRLRGRLIRNVQ